MFFWLLKHGTKKQISEKEGSKGCNREGKSQQKPMVSTMVRPRIYLKQVEVARTPVNTRMVKT